ncbi:hypothetical protein EVAR_45987_1 [Eumeta japonica]|uniref:Uncharacterized protein n=1 Tax=Eumeta variegata TaxID=151549 RepID=A0A4C1XB83_EUMVA|nr:hypothetical protein EVAR_45987_1 [Eumeta japonica]
MSCIRNCALAGRTNQRPRTAAVVTELYGHYNPPALPGRLIPVASGTPLNNAAPTKKEGSGTQRDFDSSTTKLIQTNCQRGRWWRTKYSMGYRELVTSPRPERVLLSRNALDYLTSPPATQTRIIIVNVNESDKFEDKMRTMRCGDVGNARWGRAMSERANACEWATQARADA